MLTDAPLAGEYERAKKQVYAELEKARRRPETEIKFEIKDIPGCIRYVLDSKPAKNGHVNFNHLVMNLVGYFQAAGFEKDAALQTAMPFLMDYSDSNSYNTEKKRLEHFEDQWKYQREKTDYRFSCSYIHGFKFPGSAFECRKCHLNGGANQPTMNEKTSPTKAAADQSRSSDIGLTDKIKNYVEVIDGIFTTRELYDDLGLKDEQSKALARNILKRLSEKSIVERQKNQAGVWRKVRAEIQKMDLLNVETDKQDLKLPLGISSMVEFYAGNIGLLAGDTNTGKTAFLLNVVKENINNFNIHYFSSEMGPQELRMRIDLFDDFPLTHKNFNPYERSEEFADVIRPGRGNLNIIDYLEIVEDFWKIAKFIKDIHDKLRGGLAIIAVQKRDPHSDDPLGGKRGLEKPRLVISMRSGSVKLVKAKNWKSKINPNGLTRGYKLVGGCKFLPDGPWQESDTE